MFKERSTRAVRGPDAAFRRARSRRQQVVEVQREASRRAPAVRGLCRRVALRAGPFESCRRRALTVGPACPRREWKSVQELRELPLELDLAQHLSSSQ